MRDLSGVARPGDRAILEELLKRGDTLTSARHTILFFYRNADDRRDAERVLNPLAQRLQLSGWSVMDMRADALVVEAQHHADPDSINAMSECMEALAAEFDVVFDGWECEVCAGGEG